MRTLNPSLALASLVGFLAAASCTLITDVDRTKIPTDAGAEGGSPGTGGTTGTGGTSGTGGSTGGSSMGGEAGQNNAGTGGSTGGTSATGGKGGTGAASGKGGTGGSMQPTEVCKQPTGSITLKPVTLFNDGDTITLHDGVNHASVFEMDLDTKPGVASGNRAIVFNGREDQYGLASLIRDAINQAHQEGALRITATTSFTYLESGATGAAGDAGGGGAPAAAGASNGGEAGAPDLTLPAVIQLTNDLAGTRGNLNITETAGNPNFVVSGMTGGEAVACSQPASCSSNAECSGTCGSNHICK